VLARPWAGERRSASAAPRSAGVRGLRIAPRRCVERSLSEHRAQAARAARCRPCEGEFCRSPPGTDALSPDARQSLRTGLRLAKAEALASASARRVVGPSGRPPQRSAPTRPPAALLARSLLSGDHRRSEAQPLARPRPCLLGHRVDKREARRRSLRRGARRGRAAMTPSVPREAQARVNGIAWHTVQPPFERK